MQNYKKMRKYPDQIRKNTICLALQHRNRHHNYKESYTIKMQNMYGICSLRRFQYCNFCKVSDVLTVSVLQKCNVLKQKSGYSYLLFTFCLIISTTSLCVALASAQL